MEPRCFSCICAVCPIANTCEEKPCKKAKRSVYECVDVQWQGDCDIYERLCGREEEYD